MKEFVKFIASYSDYTEGDYGILVGFTSKYAVVRKEDGHYVLAETYHIKHIKVKDIPSLKLAKLED